MSKFGRVVWHDCMTTDQEASINFFKELFGWEVNDVDMGPGGYKMIKASGEDIGGFVQLDESHGMPSHWIAYVSVEDVDATIKRAESAGGENPVPPMEIANVGKFAVIKDPVGGYISAYQSATGEFSPETDEPAGVGKFCWEEMLTSDVPKTLAFYGEVFGWGNKEMEMPGAGSYSIFTRGDKDEGGTMQMPAEAQAPPHWLSYISVGNCAAAMEKIKALGGAIYHSQEIPNMGKFAVGADPTGAAFAVWQRAQQ